VRTDISLRHEVKNGLLRDAAFSRKSEQLSSFLWKKIVVPSAHTNQTKLQKVQEKFNLRSSVSYGFG
jgi:hypothetical protein